MEFLSNGSSVKSLHPGWAAHCGIMAARLARAGITGSETSIEGRFGFMALFAGGQRDTGFDFGSIGRIWHLADVAMKFHPACHYLHPFVEGTQQIRAKGVTADAVESFTCRVPAGAAGVICEPWAVKQEPPTGHAVRWSLPVIVAMTLIKGKVELEDFERNPSAAEIALAKKGEWKPLEPTAFPSRFDAEILFRLKDGAEHAVRVEDAYGNASRPASASDMAAKFVSNVGRALGTDGAAALSNALSGLADAETVTLAQFLRR
jgi:2-methylcitrate dehydratase PrpD